MGEEGAGDGAGTVIEGVVVVVVVVIWWVLVWIASCGALEAW